MMLPGQELTKPKEKPLELTRPRQVWFQLAQTQQQAIFWQIVRVLLPPKTKPEASNDRN